MLVRAALLLAFGLLLVFARPARSADELPSWNEGTARQSIVDFVSRATAEGGADFIPVAQRIAVFDNDGTLWAEQPMYFQLAFALDRVRALAPRHPEWKTQQPFKAVIEGDRKALAAAGEKGLLALVAATHSGMTTEEFTDTVTAWFDSARHPKTGRPYTRMVYQPMLELLDYLRENGFKTYIVSGGGVEFMRAFAEKLYGIPPEQVIGSMGGLTFSTRRGVPVLNKQAKPDFVDDGPGKPVGIQKFIGRRPVFAFGNSDGDLEMLQWTMSGAGLRFAGIVHHTDAEREWAYDRKSSIGKLDKALAAAQAWHWTVVDMKNDWNVVFPAGQ
ncbi:MAG TPA: HAD family hydrolase [Burkholderiales bacterium]|nr:HAD family hydrolase [Burkholderiales bacterium]